MSSQQLRRDPAPHRGFNTKAREVLLDSPKGQFKATRLPNEDWDRLRSHVCMRRSGSDEEFLRRVGLIRFHRADSEGSESDASNSDKKKPAGDEKEAFDGIDDLPKLENRLKNKHIRTLGEIGKTRSVGDLQKKTKITKTFQQMNIVKLPSAESNEPPIKQPPPPPAGKISTLFETCFLPLTIDPKRPAQYEIN